MPTKSVFQSRTIWAVLLVRGIALFWPGAMDLVRQYPEAYLVADGALWIAMRLLSKTPIGRTRDQFVQLK